MLCLFFFFKQKTAYDMRISDWSSDVCSSDLRSVMARAATTTTRRRANGKPQVPFVHKLALNQWLLSLFDVKRFEQLAEHLRNEKLEGMDERIGRASCRERVCQYV